MRNVWFAAAFVMICTVSATAQSNRIYVSGQVAANSGSRGPVDVGTIPTVGGMVGLRVAEAWSLELEMDNGFGESPERIFEGLLTSQVTLGGCPSIL